jgi:hypothetical protein
MSLPLIIEYLRKTKIKELPLRIFGTIRYRIADFALPFLWLILSPYFNYLAKQSELEIPSKAQFKNVYYLTALGNDYGINLDLSAKAWLKKSLLISEVVEIENICMIKPTDKKTILVISHLWLRHSVYKRKNFRTVWREAFILRKSGIRVWILPSDPVDIRLLFTISLYVAVAGGAVISQPHTLEQLQKFRVPHPLGPIIWTLASTQTDGFFSEIPISERQKICVLGDSGGKKRREYMASLEPLIKDLGFVIVKTHHHLVWPDYVNLIKGSQITITTSWMHEIHQHYRVPVFRQRVPTTVLTHRVLEGFAAGSVVVTTRDETLQSLGFIPQIHYLEFTDEPSIQPLIIAIGENKLDEIAMNGQIHFFNILANGGFGV